MKIAGTSSGPFSNFTKENHETFSRLKWKWFHSQLEKGDPNRPAVVEEIKLDFKAELDNNISREESFVP